MPAIFAGIAQAFVAVMWKKVAIAASEEFIEKCLDELVEHAGPKVMGWLEKKAAATDTKFDDGAVEVLKGVLKID
jgi:hypothetical protein